MEEGIIKTANLLLSLSCLLLIIFLTLFWAHLLSGFLVLLLLFLVLLLLLLCFLVICSLIRGSFTLLVLMFLLLFLLVFPLLFNLFLVLGFVLTMAFVMGFQTLVMLLLRGTLAVLRFRLLASMLALVVAFMMLRAKGAFLSIIFSVGLPSFISTQR